MDKLCRQINGGLVKLSEDELSDKDINSCDKCNEYDYYPNLIWDSDNIWWDSSKLSHAEQNLYVALCEECFEEMK